MSAIIDYILKLNICLSVVYLFYQMFLRKLTFYNWNRWYLLAYTVLSFLIPLIDVMPSLQNRNLQESAWIQWVPAINFLNQEQSDFFEMFTYWDWITAGLWLGSLVLLTRFLIRFYFFSRMKSAAQLLSDKQTKIYKVEEDIAPFSFGNAIFINTEIHKGEELEEMIAHEFVHVKQKHTIDVIWFELLCIIHWFNPFVWLLRWSARQNLEFIADNNVLKKGFDKKEYQYLLFKMMGNCPFTITNQFNFQSLKKRIAMMNSVKSAQMHVIRFLFLVPVVAVLLLSCRRELQKTQPAQTMSQNRAVGAAISKKTLSVPSGPSAPLYVIDGKEKSKEEVDALSLSPDAIESMSVLKDISGVKLYGEKGRNGVIMIKTKRAGSKPPVFPPPPPNK